MDTDEPGANTEILAHVAAPCRAVDDCYYRGLAVAYLDFDPGRTTHLAQVGGSDGFALPSIDASPLLSSPQLSFESVWDTVGSRSGLPAGKGDGNTVVSESPSSWVVPPSEVRDSQPSHPSSPSRADWPREGGNHGVYETPAGTCETTNGFRSAELSALESSPSSMCLRAADACAAAPNSGADLEGGLVISPSRADSEPPSARTDICLTPLREPLARSFSDLGPGRRSRVENGTVGRARLAAKFTVNLEVFPPQPDVACDVLEPSSLLTSNLIKLDSDLGLLRRFVSKRQLLQGREPRPFERGFWELKCAAWGTESKQQVWDYLSRYVGDGRAGWAVWLKRDAKTSCIRLFCFGHALGHMYLLLYTASRRKILGVDCTWSSGGEGLVFVGATKDCWEV